MSRTFRRVVVPFAALLAATLVPVLHADAAVAAPAHRAGVNGAWQTHIRVRTFTDLIVTSDAVWCATDEGGLLRFDRATKVFAPTIREPGAIASNHLTCLTYDRLGRLWVGTAGSGVSRLSEDGTTWELVNSFDGLPVDSVTTMTVTGDTLWIGTRRGFALWDGHRILGSLPDGNTVSFDTTFSVPSVSGIGLVSDTLWVATQSGVGYARTSTNLADWHPANVGLPSHTADHLVAVGHEVLVQCNAAIYRWDPDSLRWRPTDPLSVVHAMKQEQGTAYVTSSVGMFRYLGGGTFTQIPNAPVGTPAYPDEPEPGAGPTGTMDRYAGTHAGLWEEASGAWVLYPVPGPPGNGYSNLSVDRRGDVYAATRYEGIGRWDGSSWYAWLPGLCNNCPNAFRNCSEVFAMVADPNGSKWVGCWGYAMEAFDDTALPAAFTHYWTPNNPVGGDPRHTLAFGAAAESVMVGGQPAGGGTWFGMDTNDLGVVQPLGLDYYDSTGTYAGTWGPGSSATSVVRAGKIRAVTVDKTGRIWVGYAGSANSGVDTFVRRPEVGYDVRTVSNTYGTAATSLDIWGLVAHDDNIWVLTDRDLKRVDRSGNPPKILSVYNTPAGRPLGMRLIDASPDGSVWVGSEEGVRWYHPDGTSQDFTTANSPLAANDVRAIAVEPSTGAVWFGTAEGLNRFNPSYQPPALPPGKPDTLHVYPNPATVTGLGVELRLMGAATTYTGGIYDVRGRLLHRFSVTDRSAIVWDGRDGDGNLVGPGVYFVRAESGGRPARARFVLLR
ncbi:MAG: hypothetical protein HYR74_01330 [Candidatus Eisenbacteria bacterium]|nr:hypothetical protein [Candidatus Eisenbacteria bacterium]